MSRACTAYGVALVLIAALFFFFSGIDLWASGLFYRVGDGFFLGQRWPLRAVYAAVPYTVDAVVVVVPILFLLSVLRRRPFCGVDRRVAAFLLLSLVLGPGLVVNTVFKDHWGRARPAQIVDFGGTQNFTPAPFPADQCARNCSFPAGHPAIGFYLVSFAFLIRDARRRRLAEGAAITTGALIGIIRMAQGGHFLSDVVFSGFFVYATSWLLYHAIVVQDVPAMLLRRADTARLPRRFALFVLGTGAAAALSMAFIDRPLALYFRDSDPTVQAVFQFITLFGLSKGYLLISAALFLALRIGARLKRDAAIARSLMLNAYRALFVFLVVGISGLATDSLKVIFGRARPKLLFRDDFYGFTWGATQADYWSFPSGHATTAAALAAAVFLLWPRVFPVVAPAAFLVMASRIIIGAHYLSDVMVGGVIGVTVAWAIWVAFARKRAELSDTP